MKRVREVDAVVASLKRLQASGGSQLVHGERIRKAVNRLEAIGKNEKASRTRLVREIAEISQIVCDEYLKKPQPPNEER